MGFFLLQDALGTGMFFAVNSSHVDDILPQRDSEDGAPVCRLKLSSKTEGYTPLAFGARTSIQDLVLKAAKIGVRKIEARTFVGQKHLRATPLILNKIDRVVLIREIKPERLVRAGIKTPTASEIFLDDGDIKLIAERPGVFAMQANAEGKVPMLDMR